jgi:aminoglycoside phosphotransferase family enzyme/predicted kinase
MIVEDQHAAIAFLSDPASYGGAGDRVERIETHISIVFLAGSRAYKLKRAVRFSYLDFSTVEDRRRACAMELELNRRTAPDLYMAVAEIRRGPEGVLAFGDAGELVDCVVVMKRFDQAALLDNIARQGGLGRALMQNLADRISLFHRLAEVDRAYGGVARLRSVIESNATNLALAPAGVFDQAAVPALTAASAAALQRWGKLAEERRTAGKVRLCHGDLHLRNICLIDGQPILFDCIEFSRPLACIDVLYDLSFLLMDLAQRGFPGWANFIFNRYFDIESEVEGAALLPLFMSMHAAIRAHVTAAALPARPADGTFERSRQEASAYLEHALSLLAAHDPLLLAVGGPSGTGKSSLAYAIAPELGPPPGARVLRSDVIRKRLMGVAPETRLPPEAYSRAVNNAVYGAMLEEARRLTGNGGAVVLDAVFGQPAERAAAAALAAQGGIDFRSIWLDAPADILEARIGARSRDASDATVEVVRRQLGELKRPSDWDILDASGGPSEVLAGARTALAAAMRPAVPPSGAARPPRRP